MLVIPPVEAPRPPHGGSAQGPGQPPHNLEAEQSVIGSLLLDREAIIAVSPILHPQDFYAEAHGIIYAVIVELYERRQPADYVTLTDELERRDLLKRVGDRSYLPTLAAAVPSGFVDLDRLMGGMQRSDLIVLAARPAMGKCLTWDTLIVDPRIGERVTIQKFVEEQRPVALGMSILGNVETKHISHWIDSGIKPCFRVRTRTGREVKVTGHHPFFTVNGWTPLHDLCVGDAIAVPARMPVFGHDDSVPDDLVRLLAYYIAEGSVTRAHRTPGFTNTDPVLVDDFKSIIARHFPACAIRCDGITYFASQPSSGRHAGKGAILPPNPVRMWLEEYGVHGLRAEDKHIPSCAWRWD